jgi:hypothetical protein
VRAALCYGPISEIRFRQTPLPKWKPLIPLFEAVMNSFQAVRDAKRTGSNGFIRITIERENALID